ncbi:MAG TPA: exo-alpha-sialidase [Vicinamibacteria bacterium]
MVETQHVDPKKGDVVLMVGTSKGSFLFHAKPSRRKWRRGGPHFPGHAVYAMAYDDRDGRRRMWAGPESMHWGAVLRWSDDFGRTWSEGEGGNVRFPEETGASLKRIWQIEPGREAEPEALYCGVEPAALFESKDAGETWSLTQGLWNHPHRPQWQPGGGGLCLHTILPHPDERQRLHVAISAAGVYRTDDDGATWRTAHKGVRAEFLPDKHPEFGQCVHKIVRHSSRPDRLFLQNHFGLYRSDDSGDSWEDIANGVPSDFGFAMAMHPHDRGTVYIVPLEADVFRCTPEGRLRVYRTKNGGKSWKPLKQGLPQEEAFETVLRDAMATDTLDEAGVYFGTRSGRLFASRDGGDSWTVVAENLPPILCVKTLVVAKKKKEKKAKTKARAKAKAEVKAKTKAKSNEEGPKRKP